MKYIDAEKLNAGIRRRIKELDNDKYLSTHCKTSRIAELHYIDRFIDSLQQEQPDNEDIDKVAQELYEHLYELKRRNNVPTNLYDKQEIIALWKAGIEYAYNHPKQEQPEGDLADIKYLREDTVVSTIKDYLANWLDAYKIERLIDKIEKL